MRWSDGQPTADLDYGVEFGEHEGCWSTIDCRTVEFEGKREGVGRCSTVEGGMQTRARARESERASQDETR